MAVDVCSDISNIAVSPRISFSHYLNEDDCSHGYNRLPSPPLSDDFEFPVGKTDVFLKQVCAADEVFSHGIILPLKQKEGRRSGVPPAPVQTKRGKEWDLEERERPGSNCSSSINFWRIGRSASVNGDGNRVGRGLLRSLHFLSRSNSTGSVTGGNKQEEQKRGLRKPPHSSSSSSYWNSNGQQKRPFRRSCRQRGGEGVRVMPVLNITPICISKATSGLFRPLICGGAAAAKEMKKK